MEVRDCFVRAFDDALVINPLTTLPASFALASVDKTKPGFKVRTYQMENRRAPGERNIIVYAERALAQGYLDPATGQPNPNTADYTAAGSDGYFIESEVINYNYQAPTAVGYFSSSTNPAREDKQFPGLPGTGSSYSGLENYITELTTYLELKRGVYVFGFNSDDGFIAMSAPNVNDTLGTLVGFFNGGRGNAYNLVAPVGQNPPVVTPGTSSGSTLFSVIVPEDGIYPFRILYGQGAPV